MDFYIKGKNKSVLHLTPKEWNNFKFILLGNAHIYNCLGSEMVEKWFRAKTRITLTKKQWDFILKNQNKLRTSAKRVIIRGNMSLICIDKLTDL